MCTGAAQVLCFGHDDNTEGQMLTRCMIWVLALGGCVFGQVSYPSLEVHVSDLPTLKARTEEPSDVLRTSLDTILSDREVCCGKDSALEDSLDRADPTSIKEIAEKLQGRHLLSEWLADPGDGPVSGARHHRCRRINQHTTGPTHAADGMERPLVCLLRSDLPEVLRC